MNYYELIKTKLYWEEICISKDHGCNLYAPSPVCGYPPEGQDLGGGALELSGSVKDFYTQVSDIELHYEISEGMKRGRPDTSIQFKEDVWLKEHYLDAGYTWEALKILVSGHMQIASLDDILDIDKIKSCGLYDASIKVGLEAGSLRPLDFNEFAISCLKVEDGKLIDNVYVYAGFGEYEPTLFDMKVGLEKYLELAYKAKCFNYWNLIYCMREKVQLHALMKHTWPMLFPQLTPDLEEFGISY